MWSVVGADRRVARPRLEAAALVEVVHIPRVQIARGAARLALRRQHDTVGHAPTDLDRGAAHVLHAAVLEPAVPG